MTYENQSQRVFERSRPHVKCFCGNIIPLELLLPGTPMADEHGKRIPGITTTNGGVCMKCGLSFVFSLIEREKRESDENVATQG